MIVLVSTDWIPKGARLNLRCVIRGIKMKKGKTGGAAIVHRHTIIDLNPSHRGLDHHRLIGVAGTALSARQQIGNLVGALMGAWHHRHCLIISNSTF